MRARDPERHPSGVWGPLVLTAGVLGLELAEGAQNQFVGVLAAMPLLAAALTGPLLTACVGMLVTAAAFGVGFLTEDPSGAPVAFSDPQLMRLGFIVGATVLGVAVARSRAQTAARFRRVASVAEAAQQAILRPIPSSVGPVDCASVYLSATTEATIGGDLVEVLDTPHGVRAVVGDVRGKGMDAVRLAGQVVGSFREVAWTVEGLPEVGVALDRAVRRTAGPEDFVTAALVQLTWNGALTVVTCGHPPPYVVDPGGGPAVPLEVDPSPPLGMLEDTPVPVTTRLAPTDRLVLVTDGLLEARRPRRLLDRRSGQFLPAEEVLGRALATGPLPVGLQAVVADVRAWARRRLRDDLAVLALQVRPSGPVRTREQYPEDTVPGGEMRRSRARHRS
jgi:sigma-B regulation protein RsbU (phosphoserine phosphatase)